MASEIDQEQPSQLVSFTSFRLEPHVRAALALARQFAAHEEVTVGGVAVTVGGVNVRSIGPPRPIGAFDLLHAICAIAQSGRAPSGDDSSFVALNRMLEIPELPPFAMSSGDEQQSDESLHFDFFEPLAESLRIMLKLEREGSQTQPSRILGRELVTGCLLATEDPSLQRLALSQAKSLGDLQDAWHEFLLRGSYGSTWYWKTWWRLAGVPLPEERARGATRRVIDTGWHPLADGMPPDWASGWGQDRFGVYVEFTVDDVTQRLRWIPPGRFTMGSPEDEAGRRKNEAPQHVVTLEAGFWLLDTLVTQALWAAVMSDNPSEFKSPDRPVEQVSWDDVQGFLERLNERIARLNLELPSEAQWEYACRAGTEMATYEDKLPQKGASNDTTLDAIAWYDKNSGGETHPVALKNPNAWGLCDMLGNVLEWCEDHWHDSYGRAPSDGSAWIDATAERDKHRIIRGGSWNDEARDCRAASRRRNRPDYRYEGIGFRPARVPG